MQMRFAPLLPDDLGVDDKKSNPRSPTTADKKIRTHKSADTFT